MSEINSVQEENNPHGIRFEQMPAHIHWDGYDMSLEGCRYNILDGLVTEVPFKADDAERIVIEIKNLAHSKGYGDEDSYLNDTGSMTKEDIEESNYHSAVMEQHEDDPDSQYTEETRISLVRLAKVAVTSEAKALVANIEMVVSSSRERGASARREMDISENLAPSRSGL